MSATTVDATTAALSGLGSDLSVSISFSVANEFIAYDALGKAEVGVGKTISERTAIVMTYALAGFSNFGAIGIQVGGIGGLEPARKKDLAQLGLRAMFGGLLACCMTGAIAGLLL